MDYEEVEDNYVEEFELAENVHDIPSLLMELFKKEQEYREAKLEYKKQFNQRIVTFNWDEINKERKEEGMPKLGSKEMREAFVDSLIEEYKEAYIYARVEYHHLYKMYEFALKYSFEVLRK